MPGSNAHGSMPERSASVSRQISALRKDGVIELEGKRHVTVPDFDRLLEEAGDDNDGGMLA